MKVLGFGFKKINIEKLKELEPDYTVNINAKIRDIKKVEDLKLINEKNVFNFEYQFEIGYEPEFAKIVFDGSMLVIIPNEDMAKDLQKQWKEKQVPEDIKLVLMNIMFSKCNLRAQQLEEDLNLPSHVPTPPIMKQNPNEDNNISKK